MPAAEETWRRQPTLNIVFALSSLGMLVVILWMMADDHWREWKRYQREFHSLESAQYERQLQQAQADLNKKQLDAVQQRITEAKQQLDARRGEVTALEGQMSDLRGAEQYAKQALDFAKANLQQARSAVDAAVRDELGESEIKRLDDAARAIEERIDRPETGLEIVWERAKAELDAAQAKLKELTDARDTAEEDLKQLDSNLQRTKDSLEASRLTAPRRLLTLPIIDAFNSPLKIQTIWLPELRQKVGSFGEAARFDRCTTCHIPIDRSAPGTATEPGWPKKTSPDDTEGYDHPFVTHPRLDLYVASSSPHPMLQFGCTICHDGQGSDTSFVFASHTPNTVEQAREWQAKHGWYDNHYWNFPQWPKRFVESTCLKCHHDVVELDRSKKFGTSAPKVTEGYYLIRQYGCFGCHEINGFDEGRSIGPDLRVEPATPQTLARSTDDIVSLLNKAPSPVPGDIAALVEATNDPKQIPGELRKVGPSLVRLVEKTTPDWARRWIKRPRDFRPKTRMPHFYGLYNNRSDELSRQRADVEVQAIVHYLFRESREHLASVAAAHAADPADLQQETDTLRSRFDELNAKVQDKSLSLSRAKELDSERKDLARQLAAKIQARAYREEPLLVAPPVQGDAQRGRELFLHKGCLACHSHAAFPTNEFPQANADFGPDLSNIAVKLIPGPDGKPGPEAYKWLFNWLRNPRIHNPRGYMPNLQLEEQDAADIAAWLLSQPGKWAKDVEVPDQVDEQVLDDLVLTYLRKAVPLIDARDYLKDNKGIPEGKEGLRGDELELVGPLDTAKKLAYVGRKTIGRQGCFGCHDIPGFETAKPIGTGLADWGRKDTDLLAFERVGLYLQEHGAAERAEKNPDFAFYYDAIQSHKRYGFIWQKLHEPRSYDYGKLDLTLKPYEDRLRMPQFRFGESDALNDAKIEKIITFVLGLVSDPPAAKFVYQPEGPAKSRIEGTKLLTRFNCVGCHVLEMPQFTFKVDPEYHDLPQATIDVRATDYAFHTPHFLQDEIERSRKSQTATVAGLVMGSDAPDDPESVTELYVDLWQPALIMGKAWEIGESIIVPPKSIVSQKEAFGGHFATLLVGARVREENRPDFLRANAWPTVPPPLVREGQKVRTEWLYQFLLNPKEIRPAVLLRMPAFNLSDHEARTLAEYFAAADGVTPYDSLAETSPGYLARREAEHHAEAGPEHDYLEDGFKIVSNPQVCMQCHPVAGHLPVGKPGDHGPNLSFAPQRFRADWLLRWLGNPKRVLPYTGMPQNIPSNNPQLHQEQFPAKNSLEQLTAVRDVLLNYNKLIESRLAAENPPAAAARAGGAGQ